jgi:hypothetical protein
VDRVEVCTACIEVWTACIEFSALHCASSHAPGKITIPVLTGFLILAVSEILSIRVRDPAIDFLGVSSTRNRPGRRETPRNDSDRGRPKDRI